MELNHFLKPLSTIKNKELSFFDEDAQNSDGSYRICLDTVIDECHHDIISYYDDYFNDYFGEPFSYGVVGDDKNDMYIQIKLSENENIIIENGSWYIA